MGVALWLESCHSLLIAIATNCNDQGWAQMEAFHPLISFSSLSAGINFWDVGLPAGAEALEKEISADEPSEKAETTEEPAALNDANEASLPTTAIFAVRKIAARLF